MDAVGKPLAGFQFPEITAVGIAVPGPSLMLLLEAPDAGGIAKVHKVVSGIESAVFLIGTVGSGHGPASHLCAGPESTFVVQHYYGGLSIYSAISGSLLRTVDPPSGVVGGRGVAWIDGRYLAVATMDEAGPIVRPGLRRYDLVSESFDLSVDLGDFFDYLCTDLSGSVYVLRNPPAVTYPTIQFVSPSYSPGPIQTLYTAANARILGIAADAECGVAAAVDSAGISFLDRWSADADRDGVCDTWEVFGLRVGATQWVPPGAQLSQQDLYVEIDAMEGRAPTQSAINMVRDALAVRPDGSSGIALHASPVSDIEVLSRRTLIVPDGAAGVSTFFVTEFRDSVRLPHFGKTPYDQSPDPQLVKARARVYRYALFADTLFASSSRGMQSRRGVAAPYGKEFIVALGTWQFTSESSSRVPGGNDSAQAGQFMHELGHTIGLRDGGGDDNQYKPNYRSVMSYYWAEYTLLNAPHWKLQYSPRAYHTIRKLAFDEQAGFGGSDGDSLLVRVSLIDDGHRWVREVGSVDINQDGSIATTQATWLDEAVPDPLTNLPLNENWSADTLRSYDDWSLLRLPLERGGIGGNGQLCQTQWQSDALVEGRTPCDCNRNSQADWRDIESGRSADVGSDGVPDECQRSRVSGLPTHIEVCPGGDGHGLDFWMDFDNLCAFDRTGTTAGLRAVLRRVAGSTVKIWTEWGAVSDTFTVAEFGSAPARARFLPGAFVSGQGEVWFDLVSMGKVILSTPTIRIRSFDQDSSVSGAVDKFDRAALLAAFGAGPSLPYDFDVDGEVGNLDLVTLESHLGHSQVDLGVTYPGGGTFAYGAFIPVAWQRGVGDSARAILKLGRLAAGGAEQELARNLLDDGGELWPAYVTDSPRNDYYLRLIRTAGVWDGSNAYGTGLGLFSAFAIDAPAGGCPRVEVATKYGWVAENTILGRSLTGQLGLDSYRMTWAPAGDSVVRVRIRENEAEITTLDDVRLIAIDHPPEVAVFASDEKVVAGRRVPSRLVTTRDGRNITDLVNGSGAGYAAVGGDTIYVGAQHSALALGASAASDHEGDPIIIDDGGGKGGPQAHFAARPMSASEADEHVLRSTGILVQALQDDGAWATVAHHYPRERPSEALLEDASAHAVRLVFLDAHRINFIGRLARVDATLSASKLSLVEGLHSRLGDVTSDLTSSGNLATTLQPGDTLELEFANVPLEPGLAREYFLLSRGVYTSSLPAGSNPNSPPGRESTPPRFGLSPNRPNPFGSSTVFSFESPVSAEVRLEVFDLEGRRVRMLFGGVLPPGRHTVAWDRVKDDGELARAGIYFARLTAPGFSEQRRLVLLP